MNFETFAYKLKENFNRMVSNVDYLFEVDADRDEIWGRYLWSFPSEANMIFRERRENDCSACKSFIRNIGGAVTIKDGVVKTIWGFDIGDAVYQKVLNDMDAYVKTCAVNNVYHSDTAKIGIPVNREATEGGIIEWHHLHVTLPATLVASSTRGIYQSKHRDNRETLHTSLDVITEESISVVLELISSNSLYRGDEWKEVLVQFLHIKQAYLQQTDDKINNWLWSVSTDVGPVISKIKNHSIGTLLQNIASGMDLELAVRKYEAIIAPENYKRPKPIFTAAMLTRAQKIVTDMGYLDSLPRRFAVIDDITIQNLLYADRSVAKQLGVFEEMSQTVSDNPAKYGKVDELGIEQFIANVLPGVTEMEVMVENKHLTNLVSLIAPGDVNSKSMFKWGNNFSWAYNGNMADSSMRDNVKAAGGSITGDLRFSIQWNDIDRDGNDLDAHCVEPKGYEIYYGNKRSRSPAGGTLDVDIISPSPGVPAVENIVYARRENMDDGVYKMFVYNFSNRGGTAGFRAEIEFDGVIYAFDYAKSLRQGEVVHVAEITVLDGKFTIREMINSATSCREVWGISVNKFVPVSSMCLSPNYWNGLGGNKHYMFMLKGCINPDRPNGFFNEYLAPELREHGKVFEALGSKMRVEDCVEQLSGLGFSSTKHADIIVRVKGKIDRALLLKF